MSIVLAGLLLFANSVCACASGTDGVSDDPNPHAHHQMQDEPDDVGNVLCAHQDCEGCESLAVGATSDRDSSKLFGFSKANPENDVVWIEAAPNHPPSPPPLLARAGPPVPRPSLPPDTPVRRADLLLE